MFFDIGWSEMLVIAVVAFIVIGPKDLPQVLRAVANLTAKARAAGRLFQQQLDEVMREAGAEDLKRQIDDALNVDPRHEVEKAITGAVDPEGDINRVWNGPPDVATPTGVVPATTEPKIASIEPSEAKPAPGKAS